MRFKRIQKIFINPKMLKIKGEKCINVYIYETHETMSETIYYIKRQMHSTIT